MDVGLQARLVDRKKVAKLNTTIGNLEDALRAKCNQLEKLQSELATVNTNTSAVSWFRAFMCVCGVCHVRWRRVCLNFIHVYAASCCFLNHKPNICCLCM